MTQVVLEPADTGISTETAPAQGPATPDEPYIALDTETTGIGPKWNRIIEIAAIEFDGATGAPTGNNFYTLLNPECEISEEATKVHGKTTEMLKDAPRFADIVEPFLAYVGGRQLVIHNKPFDEGFLDEELKRIKLKRLSTFTAGMTCTLELSRQYVRGKKHTLDVLCDRYGVDRSKRVLHGALEDCELLAAVYPHLMVEVRRIQERIQALMPFDFQGELPQSLDELALQELQVAALVKVLESVRKPRTDAIKKMLQGTPHEGDFYSVEFKGRTTTDWERVIKENLGGEAFNLKPYQVSSSAMSVRFK